MAMRDRSARTVRGFTERNDLIVAEIEAGDDMLDVRIDGRHVGRVDLGANHKWFWVPLSRIAHAHPFEGDDNVRRTGHGSREQAAMAGLGIVRPLDDSPGLASARPDPAQAQAPARDRTRRAGSEVREVNLEEAERLLNER